MAAAGQAHLDLEQVVVALDRQHPPGGVPAGRGGQAPRVGARDAVLDDDLVRRGRASGRRGRLDAQSVGRRSGVMEDPVVRRRSRAPKPASQIAAAARRSPAPPRAPSGQEATSKASFCPAA